MNILFRDFENPTILLPENTGYLYEVLRNDDEYLKNCYSWEFKQIEHIDGVTYIKSVNNMRYFHEADCLIKINMNKNNYFDFSKSIIDIGAQYGCYSFRSNFNYIYAFEPNERVYHMLCVNLMLHNKYDISEIYNVALSDKNEVIEFDGFNCNINNNFNKKSTYLKNISTHTLDEYHCENVGLIKVDVEGMEEKVLRGGINTIKNNNYPPILFELWNVDDINMTQEKHDSLVNFLTELGYEIIWNYGLDDMTHLAIHK